MCGQYIGKKRPHKACEAADQLLLVTTALSVVIMAAVYLLKPFILHVVFGNITAEVERNCNIYLMIVHSVSGGLQRLCGHFPCAG